MINSNLIKNVEFLNKYNSKQNLKPGSFADMNQTHSDIVLEIDTDLTPFELIKKCKEIEKKLGRKKMPKNSPRECDIDIIDFRNKKTTGDLILPHPSMDTRNFVLLPLFEINKDWKHPILKVNIRKLISSLSNSDIRSIKQI